MIPALVGVLWLGSKGIGPLLVLTQVVLSLQLPFALYPLLRFTASRRIMGEHVNGPATASLAWILFLGVTAANLWLLWTLARP